jgi:hypothetical protein
MKEFTHQSGNGCGGAIDRAILRHLSRTEFAKHSDRKGHVEPTRWTEKSDIQYACEAIEMAFMQAGTSAMLRALEGLQGLIGRVRLAPYRVMLRLSPGKEIVREDWAHSLVDPSGFYVDSFQFFHKRLPNLLKEHRRYFTQEQRGFGDDAFHAMWFWLFREFRFTSFLEIGVYRGQTLSLAALLQRSLGIQGTIVGISPFTPIGDAVSRYRVDLNYLEDTLENFKHFDLPSPHLIRSLSTDKDAIAAIRSREWDCIYIDGGHDYAVAKADWDNAAASIKRGGVIVMDDAALYTNFRSPFHSFKGHPGPSQVADEVGPDFIEILRVGHNRAFMRAM